ncbi:YkgJ family cysteine cluster protein [Desulfolucanica intricata]|uniref:YkgJ family cysteine cluster protein n=1 Tax=Desulfolucanica intricata TaxID=1285191 RepID=UPI00082DDF6C|nr:YkgJ family cysteine cluster protein [Desulfolucanica intricata]
MDTLLNLESKFRFSCHEGLQCFKKCCRDINIFLSPYDVLRMKNKLKISSQEFLNKYTIRLTAKHSGFPFVLLKMVEENDLVCPFITPKGCQVYEARPWACRMAPVDIRGENQFGFIFEPSRCHGLNEAKEQTVREWMQEQGLGIYEEVEELFKELPGKIKFSGQKDLDQKLNELIYLACYNLDKFRDFIFKTGFLQIFRVSPEVLEQIKKDDVELMKFAFKWLAFDLNKPEKQREAAKLLK